MKAIFYILPLFFLTSNICHSIEKIEALKKQKLESNFSVIKHQVKSASAPLPASGYIVFVGTTSDGKVNLYKQEMQGLTPIGSPVILYEDSLPNNEVHDARYPKITNDGRYIIFITRKTNVLPDQRDEVRIFDHQGQEWASGLLIQNATVHCESINYPEIIYYNYTGGFSQHDIAIAALCVNHSSLPVHSTTVLALGPNNSYFYHASSATQSGLEAIDATEFAVFPGYQPSSGGYIFSTKEGALSFSKFTPQQSHHDYQGSWKVHIDSASRYDGGICSLPQTSPCPVPLPPDLRKAFSPSISPDGRYLMFNSEAYRSDTSRGDEMFVIGLPQSDIKTAYTPSWPSNPNDPINLGYLSHIQPMPHANQAGNEYGFFTVNGQYHYSMHRNGNLYFAPDLTTPPILINIGQDLSAGESRWFYKN